MSNIDEQYLIRFWYDNSSNYHANSYVVDDDSEIKPGKMKLFHSVEHVIS